MKIIMITKSQQNRGSYMRLFPLAKSMSEMGHEVTLICPHEYANPHVERVHASPALEIILLPRYRFRTHFLGMMLRALLIIPLVSGKHADVIHVCSPAFPDTWLSVFLGLFLRIPVLLDIDDLWGFSNSTGPFGGRTKPEEMLEEFLLKTSILSASVIVTASDILRERYIRLRNDQIHVIWHGIDRASFTDSQMSLKRKKIDEILCLHDGNILILGQIFKQDIPALSIALERLNSMGFDVYAILPGSLPDAPEGNRINYEMQGRIYFAPRMARSDFLALSRSADLILFSMKDTDWERARLPVKVTEFLFTGTPLISLSFGETKRLLAISPYSEVINEFPQQMEDDNLVRSISFFLENMDTVRTIALKARDFAIENLASDRIALQLLKIYTSMQQ